MSISSNSFAQLQSDRYSLTNIQNVKESGARGNGVTDDTISFIASAAKAINNILFVPKGTYVITSNVTFGASVTVFFSNGVTLDIANTKTVTVSGKLITPYLPTITGLGTFTYSSASMPAITVGGKVDLTSGVTGVLPIANGGTNKALTLSAGGIVWTDADSMEILSGTATAQKLVMSQANAAPVWSTPTYPNSAAAGKILVGDGTNIVLSTPAFPNASATAGKVIISNGTNWIASTQTFPTTATAGKIFIGDGTNIILSTPGYPNASATAGKFIISDGTNWIASTPTIPNAATGTGKLLRADGTNWVATTFTIPDTFGINTVPYASAANVLSAIAAVNSGVLVTSAGGVPSISTTLPNGLTFGTLGANWDIGDTRHIITDTVQARDGAGLELFDDGGFGIFVKDGGNIGIGTINPYGKLHTIVGTTVATSGLFSTSDWDSGVNGSGLIIRMGATTGNTYSEIGSLSTGGGAWNNLILNSGGGKVGIGTVSPTGVLHVVGLPIYANNAAAISGGLTAGAFYRTGGNPDPVCVVH